MVLVALGLHTDDQIPIPSTGNTCSLSALVYMALQSLGITHIHESLLLSVFYHIQGMQYVPYIVDS
jgi:hypothetical protein